MKHTVSEASVNRYLALREEEQYKSSDDSWNCFEEWTKREGFSKVGTYWDAMRIICRKDRAFLMEVIWHFQQAQEKLDKIVSTFDMINDLAKEEGGEG
tara:strand:- start:774 stop:1067 length:294 start_codon:yes stop_codon:yes gene_type:complete